MMEAQYRILEFLIRLQVCYFQPKILALLDVEMPVMGL